MRAPPSRKLKFDDMLGLGLVMARYVMYTVRDLPENIYASCPTTISAHYVALKNFYIIVSNLFGEKMPDTRACQKSELVLPAITTRCINQRAQSSGYDDNEPEPRFSTGAKARRLRLSLGACCCASRPTEVL